MVTFLVTLSVHTYQPLYNRLVFGVDRYALWVMAAESFKTFQIFEFAVNFICDPKERPDDCWCISVFFFKSKYILVHVNNLEVTEASQFDW